MPIAQFLHQFLQMDRLARVHASGRFVEQQQRGFGRHGTRDLETPLGPIGQVVGGFVDQILEAQFLEQRIAVLDDLVLLTQGRRRPQDGAENRRTGPTVTADHHVFQHGHVLEQPDVLERSGHPQFGDDIGLQAVDPLAGATRLEMDVAAGGNIDAGDAVEDRGLARAVGADQRDDLARHDVQADVIDGAQTAEVHGQVLDVENRAGFRHGRRPLRFSVS